MCTAYYMPNLRRAKIQQLSHKIKKKAVLLKKQVLFRPIKNGRRSMRQEN